MFRSQHKITFCENYFHCRYAMLRVYYVLCTDVEIFKHKLHKTALTRNYYGRRIAHLGTNMFFETPYCEAFTFASKNYTCSIDVKGCLKQYVLLIYKVTNKHSNES